MVSRPARRRAGHGVRAAVAVVAVSAMTGVGATPARADAVRDGQWYLSPLGITKAQAVTDGRGVTVSIIDSGVDGSITDLHGVVVGGKDFSGRGSANGQTPIGGDSHGTNVASVLAGRGRGPGSGVLGSAPGVKIISASVDNVAKTNAQQVVNAVRWSADQGVGVINMSISGGRSAADLAAYRYAESKDVVIVAASGNQSASRGLSPCGLPGIVCVGGIDKNLQHDPLANTDPSLAVVGPFATVAGAQNSTNDRDGIPVAETASSPTKYTGEIGTSLSSPIVAGVVALIRAKYPKLDAANVVNRLIKTATPAGSGTPNATYGYGIVNADKALTASVPTAQTNPLGTLVTQTTTPSPSSAPSTSTTADGSSSSAPAIGQASDDGGSNTGLIVGIVVAVVVIGGLAAYLLTRRRRTSTSEVH